MRFLHEFYQALRGMSGLLPSIQLTLFAPDVIHVSYQVVYNTTNKLHAACLQHDPGKEVAHQPLCALAVDSHAPVK